MAANENTQTPRDDAPDHDQAATAGHDAAGNPANLADRTPAEILAENVRLQKAIAETNRKHKADRFKVEEYEKQQREAEEAKLGEAERFKRDRDAAQQARQAAEGAAKSAREELERFKLDLEIERLALASGFLYPENAPKLVDRDLIDFDEDTHKPTNLKDVLKKLVDRQPGLVQATAQRGGTPPRNGPVPRNGAGPAPREPIPLELDLMRKVNYPGGRSFS